MTLEVVTPSMGGHEAAMATWYDMARYKPKFTALTATEGEEAGFLTKCQRAYEQSSEEVIGYLHSDLFIHEPGWDERVRLEFQWPTVAVVGFVGATQLGHPDVYRVPYDFRQLARYGVWSNLTDAEVHGQRETGSKAVAVLDSCAIFVRRSFLQRLGGWPLHTLPNSSHCTDLWICGQAARLGRQVRMVGVSCTHASGGKGVEGSKWLDARGGDTLHHRQAHRAVYEALRGVLPLKVA